MNLAHDNENSHLIVMKCCLLSALLSSEVPNMDGIGVVKFVPSLKFVTANSLVSAVGQRHRWEHYQTNYGFFQSVLQGVTGIPS
jgi:hypothetical protein